MKRLILLFLTAFSIGIDTILAHEVETEVMDITYDFFNNPSILVKVRNNSEKTIDYIKWWIKYKEYSHGEFVENGKLQDVNEVETITTTIGPSRQKKIDIEGKAPTKTVYKFHSMGIEYVHFTDGTIKDKNEL